MGDHNTGLAAAGAISAALFARERTGQGQLVSTSLLREGMYTMSFDVALTWTESSSSFTMTLNSTMSTRHIRNSRRLT